MILQRPKTLEDFLEVKETIVGLINNPYADKGMIEKLKVRLENIKVKIKELEN